MRRFFVLWTMKQRQRDAGEDLAYQWGAPLTGSSRVGGGSVKQQYRFFVHGSTTFHLGGHSRDWRHPYSFWICALAFSLCGWYWMQSFLSSFLRRTSWPNLQICKLFSGSLANCANLQVCKFAQLFSGSPHIVGLQDRFRPRDGLYIFKETDLGHPWEPVAL